MVERTINKDILNSINEFVKEIKKHYNISATLIPVSIISFIK